MRWLATALCLMLATSSGARAEDPFLSAPPLTAVPDPFHSAPPPPTPRSRPASAPPVAAPTPRQTPFVKFDGTYTGKVTETSATTGHEGRRCIGGPVHMKVANGMVSIQQARGNGELAHYAGAVDAAGAVSASNTTSEGWVHRVSGSISQGKFSGQILRRECAFTIDLTKE